MYDAQQGSTSGAHIDLSTASGTNEIHGQLYGHRGTNWINAAPFFYNQDPNIPAADKVPGLHRYDRGWNARVDRSSRTSCLALCPISTSTLPTSKLELPGRLCLTS